MPNLYIITGPAGVGKSTVSKKLAIASKKSALIEGDDIYHQVVGGYVPAWKEKFVVLLVDEATLLLRDKSRPEDCQMKERCITLLNNFKNRNYNPQNILDTTNLSVEEIINIIQNYNKFILWEVSVWIV